jgi:hypothetical protein
MKMMMMMRMKRSRFTYGLLISDVMQTLDDWMVLDTS